MNRNYKTLGTHSEVFHADEVHGAMLLLNYVPEFKGSKLIRSRDKSVLEKLDIVIDVGGEYDFGKLRFDHHQKGFNEYYDKKNGFGNVKLSASGLIFKHYGHQIIRNSLKAIFEDERILEIEYRKELSNEEVESLCRKMYEKYFQHLDGVDNGHTRVPKGTKTLYKETPTGIVHRIARLNTPWWRKSTPESQDSNFVKAMALAKEDYLYILRDVYMREVMCKSIVKEFVQKRKSFHPSGKIIHLEKNCAWKEALIKVEKEMEIEGEILFAIYKNITGDSYRVSTIPLEPGSFEFRLGLNEEWRGQSMEQLRKTSGIEDMVFCHHSGFIGGAVSLESALKMAVTSMEKKKEKILEE
jgi:uncharacterized UPF0160 family protein